MKRFMEWLDGHLGVLILGGGALLLAGVAWGALGEVPVDDAFARRVELSAGDYRAIVSFTKGADKPLLISPDDRSLLDVSAWESWVIVNNESTLLARHEFNYATDGKVAYVTWTHRNYSLEERIEATPEGLRVDWSWLKSPLAEGPQNVTLDLAHFAFFMVDRDFDGANVSYLLPAEDPRYPPREAVTDTRGYSVNVSLDPPPADVTFGETPFGVDAFRVRYNVTDPPVAVVTPIFSSFAQYDRTAGEVAPPPFNATRPVRDETPRDLVLRDGEYTLKIARNTGLGKPILESKSGFLVLDLSAWESKVRVDDRERNLYLHPFAIASNDTVTRMSWDGDGYTLLEEIHVHDDGAFNVSWYWRRNDDRPQERVELELAHFAPFMLDAEEVDGDVRYRRVRESADGTEAHDVAVRLIDDVRLVSFGRTPSGVDAFRVFVDFHDPPVGEFVRVLTEEIAVRPADGDAS